MESDHSGNYVCRFCKGCFTQSQLLLKHVQQVHAASPSTRSSRTCPICGTVFGKYEGYRTHLRHIHGQRNEGQIFAFKCFNDFFLWKTELEKRSSCKYSLQSAPKVLPTNEKIHVYQCDRSVLTSKKKKPTWTSSESCPAMVCATESIKNREIKVEYWNTHVGHSVPVEDDELNAAINSVQSEEPAMHVMDMLNNIGQSIETGAEVFVTETVEEEVSSSPLPRGQRNIFNIKKAKSSSVPLPKKTPIVQNFSFKKDPSKKKESSIYSLASVACGKVSAHKIGLNKSMERNPTILLQTSGNKVLDKTTKEDSVSKENEVTIASASGESNANNSSDKTNASNVKEISVGGRLIAINSLSSGTNKQEIVYNWPVGEPLPTDWVFSPDMVSSEKKSSKDSGEKLLTGKENVSSVGNKIVVPIEHTAVPSDKSTSLLKSSKVSKSKKSQPTSAPLSALNSTPLGQNLVLGTSGTVVPNMPQYVLSSVPVTQQDLNFSSSASTSSYSTVSPHFTSIAKSSNSVTQFSSILPAAQTYISVNNKLIPVMNAPGSVFPTNLGSSVLLPSTLAQSPAGKFSHTSLPTTTPVVTGCTPAGLPSYQPLTGGQSTSTLGGTISPLTTFPSSPVIIIPCTSSSTVLQSKPSTAISSPLILQSTRPMTSVPVRSSRAKSIVSTSLVPSIPKSFFRTPITQQTISRAATAVTKTISSATSISSGKLVSSTAGNLNSATLSNAVKVQKVSLPAVNSSQCVTSLDNKNMSSVPAVLQQSQVNSVVLNTSPISSTPTINIPGMTGSSVQKPGTFVFESSGELYMLEPLEEDVAKSGTPLTSTPKKTLPVFPKTPSHFTPQLAGKRKRRSPKIPKSPAIVPSKSKKIKELETSPKTVVASAPSAKVTDIVSTSGITSASSSIKTTTAAVDTVNNKVPFLTECDLVSSSEDDSESSSSVNVKTSKNISAAVVKSPKCAKDKTTTSTTKTEMTITIAPSKTPGEKEVSFISKTSPFDAKNKVSVNTSPVKPTSSFLTVKTVPSFSIPQSRPVTSFLSSVRTPLPSPTTLSTSSYISSYTTQSKTSATELTSPFSIDRDATNDCNNEMSEVETIVPVQNSEVKRGVTIKSVAQEKRCVSDDDLEVMKKVKFYKLEMKYFACQEQCKKLKIELAKALSKNRELMQIVDEKGKNGILEKESIDLIKEHTVAKIFDENQEVTESIDENIGLNEDQMVKDGEKTHRICEQEETVAVENDDLQVPTEDFNLNGLGSEMVVEDNGMALNEQKDITAVTSEELLNDIEDMEVAEEKEGTFSTTGFQQEVMDIEDVEEDSATPKDEVTSLAKPNQTSTKKDSKEINTSSDADVYTMVRTSVLRSLYSDIEDLSEEKKQLQKNLESYKRHHSKFVPLFEK